MPKTLEQKLKEALIESAGMTPPGKVAGAESTDLDGVNAGKNAASKESQASFPKAVDGMPTTGKVAGAEAEELGSEEAAKKAGEKESQASFPKKESGMPTTGKLKEDIEALLGEELSLSDEFKTKAVGLFEAAIIARSNQYIEDYKKELQEQFDVELLEAVEDISAQVDAYVSFGVKEWITENQVALEKGVRTEIAESFIAGMHTLFKENFITVPEGKEDLVESLQTKNTELNEQYNAAIKTAMTKDQEISNLKRSIVLEKLVEGMADSEADKLKTLVEGIDFVSEEDYSDKVQRIREMHFKTGTAKKTINEDRSLVGIDPVTNKTATGMEQVTTAIKNMSGWK